MGGAGGRRSRCLWYKQDMVMSGYGVLEMPFTISLSILFSKRLFSQMNHSLLHRGQMTEPQKWRWTPCHFCSYGRPHSCMEHGLAVGELGQIEEITAWSWTWRWETYLEARIKRRKKWIAGSKEHELSQRAWMSFIQQGPSKQWQPHQLLLQYSWQPECGGAKTCISRCV